MGAPPPKQASPKAASPKAKAKASPIVSEEHATSLADAPELDLDSNAFTKYYAEKMTAPQRMQTMIHLWNSSSQEERVPFLRHLIDLIDNPQVSNRIRGGQEILKDLDTNFYAGVTYPERWV